MKKIELLSPAGDLEKLKVAFAYGADAVYMGGKALGMRAKAKNFEIDEMEEGIKHAHSIGKKVYVTTNIFARNADFSGIEDYFLKLEQIKADALIISDFGVYEAAKKTIPKMEIHISTQANNTNYASVNFWKGLGAARVILARELSIGEIAEIHQKTAGIELESFVHGAMCMAYSGRCLISNFMNGRDANRGECSQPCRWNYTLMEEKSGKLLPVFEDDDGAYIFSSKDLCMIQHIPSLVNAGIKSFKIEGRIKTSYYVGVVTKAYREALDDFLSDPALYESKREYYQAELGKISHRDYTTGFYFGKMTEDGQAYTDIPQLGTQDFLAMVHGYDEKTGMCDIEQRNKFEVGDAVEVIKTKGANHCQTIDAIYNENGEKVHSAPHPLERLKLRLEVPVGRYDMIRKSPARH